MESKQRKPLSVWKAIAAIGVSASLIGGIVVAQQAQPLPPQQQQPEAPTAIEQELQQIQAELQAVSEELSVLQQRALEEPEVAEAVENFEETIHEKMIEQAPEMEAQIRRQAELSKELRDEEASQAPDFQEKVMEYQQLRQQLMPVEQEVVMDPQVQQIRENIEETMRQAIIEMDPQAEQLIERQEQLSEQFARLQQELIEQQQQQQQQQPEGAEPGLPPQQPAQPQQPAEGAEARLQGIQQELQQISMQLSEVQQAAFERPEVQERIESFENTMIKNMTELAPEREDEIARLNELTTQLRADDAQENPEEFQAKVMEYQQLKQQLGPLEEQVMEVPEVQNALEEFEEIIIAAMNEIDPRTEQLLEQRNELVREFNAIQQELMQQQAPQQPAPQ